MLIQQWEDKNLAHFSYAIVSECEKKMILIDPARNPQPYFDFASAQQAAIVGVIETHPHADFVSSHLEIHETTGAQIYASRLVGAAYPFTPFDEGSVIEIGKIKLKALNTPGHSPDSISIVLEHEGKDKAVFTGDTLFIGDCGRPDLREKAGNITANREVLARQMYHSLRKKLLTLPDDIVIYPAHGAGTLCGKALSKAESSTLAAEKIHNWSLQQMTEDEFVKELLEDQPFIPAYFVHDVALNRQGAPAFAASVQKVHIAPPLQSATATQRLDQQLLVIDARPQHLFKQGHLKNAINLMEGAKFETWLGSIIVPGEPFYLAAQDEAQLQRLIARTAAIGYEAQIKEAFAIQYMEVQDPLLDITDFRQHPEHYTIVDVRNTAEVKAHKIFNNSISVPLAELRQRIHEIPLDKPLVVHCAGGYRSAAGSSLIKSLLNGKARVYDLGEAVNNF